MPETIVLVLACLVIAAVVVYVLRKRETPEEDDKTFIPEVTQQTSSASISIGIRNPRSSEEDLSFENEILGAQKLPVEKHFYTKLFGTSHTNEDGSSRVKAISECYAGADLGMRLEPENKFDSNAIAIMFGDRQLGYLDARLAGETTRDIKRNGFRYRVYMKMPTLHPVTKRVVGAVLLVVRFTKNSAIKIN